MAIRRFAHAAVVGCGLLLAACAATPVYPLMTPIQVAKTFGYFDQPIDETHAMVSYVTPQQSGYGFRYDQSPAEAQAKTLALDMALLGGCNRGALFLGSSLFSEPFLFANDLCLRCGHRLLRCLYLSHRGPSR